MKITKTQLKQIIKEELAVILTNEEAGELFGETVEAELGEKALNPMEEDVLQEDLSAIAGLFGEIAASDLGIIVQAFAKAASSIGGGVLLGLGMSRAIDLVRDGLEAQQATEQAIEDIKQKSGKGKI